MILNTLVLYFLRMKGTKNQIAKQAAKAAMFSLLQRSKYLLFVNSFTTIPVQQDR